jgi:phosphoribosylformylglycinamidine synthase
MKARVTVTLKNGVLDPQGKAIANALGALGIEVELDEKDPASARAALERMCKELLANPVIENYRYELEEA